MALSQEEEERDAVDNLAQARTTLAEGIAEAGGGNRAILRLTDEELAVIDTEPMDERLVPSPHLAKMPEGQRDTAIATALRSLVSRELIEVANIEEIDELIRQQEAAEARGETVNERAPIDIRLAEEAALVLSLRGSAERVLAADLTASDDTSHAFVYIHAADLFLVERVTSGGMHLFTLTNAPESAAELVQALVDPFGVAETEGPEQRLSPDALDRDSVPRSVRRVIDTALVVGQLMVLSDTEGALVTTYATGKEVMTVTVDEPHSPKGIVAQTLSTRALRRKIIKLLKLPKA
ncbi:hypothetical protein [Streptomyces buecherae]|uniref:hypothetical protein n=1 Tax=Streptomyces buecherae TaxID=2763006 RepID=UPI00369BA0DA